MRNILSRFFRRCASLVGVPAIHARLDKLEESSARKVDVEGLQQAIRTLESRMLDMNVALLDRIEENGTSRQARPADRS